MMKVIPETCCVLQDMQVFTTAQKQMLMSNVQLGSWIYYDRSVIFSRYYIFFTNKTDYHDITEILLNVA
jgi:hypothetical protein